MPDSLDLIQAQLDAHDALLRACIDGTLAFESFLAAYGDFGGRLLGEGAPAAAPVAGLFKKRLLFHALVTGVLVELQRSRLVLQGQELTARVGLMRLRSLVTRYPAFEAAGSDLRAADNSQTGPML